ncbi:MAG: hypothetical protein U0Y10_01930 [Spirosomataceae bacterium]
MKAIYTIIGSILLLSLLSIPSEAQISLTTNTTTYSQNFSSVNGKGLNFTGTTTWYNEISIPGWYSTLTSVYHSAGNITTQGNSGLYDCANSTKDNRSFGSVATSSTGTIHYGVRFKNNSGYAIKSIGVAYRGKQWTKVTTATQSLKFYYKIAQTVSVVYDTDFTLYSGLNFTSPVVAPNGTTFQDIDGELAANQTYVTGVLNVTVQNGQEFMLRWTDTDDTGNDHALSIDDIDITFVYDQVPSAATTNVRLGIDAGKVITSGSSNTFLGHNTGFSSTTGIYNAYVGALSGYNTVSTEGNTLVGYKSGYYITAGTNNTFIGREAGSPSTVTTLSNATAIGANATVTASNSLILGNNANVGIGNTAPANRLEITASQTSSSGLRFTNLTASSAISSGNYTKALSVNANGDVILISSGQWNLDETGFITNGNPNGVKIGTSITTPVGYKLYVSDGILTERVKVALKSSADWSDKVFDVGYRLRSLKDVDFFIKKNKHLPNVPSAEELVQSGFDLAKMDAVLLEKIEELTLYLIEIKKENQRLKQRVEKLEKKKR